MGVFLAKFRHFRLARSQLGNNTPRCVGGRAVCFPGPRPCRAPIVATSAVDVPCVGIASTPIRYISP